MYRIAHGVLEHRLGATSVVAFITKRAGLLRQKEVGSFFVVGRCRRGPPASVLRSLGPLAHRRSSENIPSTHSGE